MNCCVFNIYIFVVLYLDSDGFNEVWEEHCQNTPKLVEYADAMHRLAIDHWGKLPETRIDWCRDTTLEYFLHGGLKKVLEKDKRREAIQSLKSGIKDDCPVNRHEHSDNSNKQDNRKMSKSLEVDTDMHKYDSSVSACSNSWTGDTDAMLQNKICKIMRSKGVNSANSDASSGQVDHFNDPRVNNTQYTTV